MTCTVFITSGCLELSIFGRDAVGLFFILAKRLFEGFVGDNAFFPRLRTEMKLDPGGSLHATSIGATLPRTTTVCSIVGSPASPVGDSIAQRNIVKNRNGTTTIRRTDQCRGRDGEANTMKNDTEVARPEQVPLSVCSLPFTLDAGLNKQDRAPEVNNGRVYSSSSASGTTTVFVRSEKWGLRRQEWAQDPRRTADDDGSLGTNQIVVTGCKPHSGTSAADATPASKREPIRRAWDRRSTAWSAQSTQPRSRNGSTPKDGRGDVAPFAREQDCMESLTVAPGRDRGAGRGPKEGDAGRKGPPAGCPRLATPRAVISRQELFPRVDDVYSAGWKMVTPPTINRNLRPGNSPRRPSHSRGPCWLTEAAPDSADKMPVTERRRRREPATVATKIGNSARASAASTPGIAVRVPQPLSVVAVWARACPSWQSEPVKTKQASPDVVASSPMAADGYSGIDVVAECPTVDHDIRVCSSPPRSATSACRQPATTTALSTRPRGAMVSSRWVGRRCTARRTENTARVLVALGFVNSIVSCFFGVLVILLRGEQKPALHTLNPYAIRGRRHTISA